MNNDDLVRLRHMADAAREALEFAAGRTRTDLDMDRMLVRALTKDIEIVGEAAARVTLETRQAIPSIPWQSIVTMRNRLIHGYFDIDSTSSGRRSRISLLFSRRSRIPCPGPDHVRLDHPMIIGRIPSTESARAALYT